MADALARPSVHAVLVQGREVLTDSEGYLLNLADWSEAFARALAQQEGLALTPAHWALIHYLRAYFQEFKSTACRRRCGP